jgi:hypothetical protein
VSDSFAERWAQKEREFGLEVIASKMVVIGGEVLPASAAPCLDFTSTARPQRIYECFGSASDWSESERVRLENFLVIGGDGAGNPICLEEPGGTVVLLDHEDRFHTRQFVNSSIPQLAECLLAYLGEEKASSFQPAVQAIDPAALKEGAFWQCELSLLE